MTPNSSQGAWVPLGTTWVPFSSLCCTACIQHRALAQCPFQLHLALTCSPDQSHLSVPRHQESQVLSALLPGSAWPPLLSAPHTPLHTVGLSFSSMKCRPLTLGQTQVIPQSPSAGVVLQKPSESTRQPPSALVFVLELPSCTLCFTWFPPSRREVPAPLLWADALRWPASRLHLLLSSIPHPVCHRYPQRRASWPGSLSHLPNINTVSWPWLPNSHLWVHVPTFWLNAEQITCGPEPEGKPRYSHEGGQAEECLSPVGNTTGDQTGRYLSKSHRELLGN